MFQKQSNKTNLKDQWHTASQRNNTNTTEFGKLSGMPGSNSCACSKANKRSLMTVFFFYVLLSLKKKSTW